MDAVKTRTLHERVLAIATEVGKIHATGENQQKKAAVSVYDVENAIRELFAKEGILTRWSFVSMERYKEPIKAGIMTMFSLTLRVKFVNALDPSDQFEDEWTDVGNSPAGAASFVRKGYYKALFHLAAEGDDKVPDYRDAGDSQEMPGVDRPWKEGDLCPECAKVGRKRRFKPAAGGPRKGELQCSFQDQDDHWQHHEPPRYEPDPSVGEVTCGRCEQLGLTTRKGRPATYYQSPEKGIVCMGFDPSKPEGEQFVMHPRYEEGDVDASSVPF